MGDTQRSGTPALAALLTQAREGAGLTRRELAEATGLSYPYISQLETGYRGPSADAMQRLTEVLDVPVAAMVAAMTERDTPSLRPNKPKPRAGPAQPSPAQASPGQPPAYRQQSRWIANPAWSPVQPAGAADAVSSPVRRRVRASAGPPPPTPTPAPTTESAAPAAFSALSAPEPFAPSEALGAPEPFAPSEALGAPEPFDAPDVFAAPPQVDTDAVVAEIVARLAELPPTQRMAALAEIQNQVVRTVVADAGLVTDPE